MNILEGSRQQPSENTHCSQRKQGVGHWKEKTCSGGLSAGAEPSRRQAAVGQLHASTDVLRLELGWLQKDPMAFGRVLEQLYGT